MRHPQSLMHIALAVCAALLVGRAALAPRTALADDPNLDEIIERLNQWKDSFKTLRVVYERRNPGQWLVRRPELAQSGDIDDYYRRYEFIYTDGGRCVRECFSHEGGRLVERELAGNDDRVAYRAIFAGGDIARTTPTQLSVRNHWTSAAPTLGGHVMPLSELWGSGGDWLGRQFNRPENVQIRYDEIDGVRCAGIRRAPDSVHTLWLDLEHDCLPRLIEPDPGVLGRRFHVEEFLKLNNGRWFPKRGTLVAGTDSPYEWKVTEAVVNEPVSPDRFAPPHPGQYTRVTGAAGAFPKLPQSDRNSELDSPSEVLQNAIIHRALSGRFWLFVTVLIASGAVLVTGLGLWKQSRRSGSYQTAQDE